MAFKLILAFVAIGVAVVSADYCSVCSEHVACPEDTTPSPTCVGIPEITQEIKDLIVDTHNKLRNQLASGKLPGYQPATRMSTLQWDDELAYLAFFNTKTCSYGHDKCRNTTMFPYAGQNIAASYVYGPGADYQPVLEVIKNSTEGWFSEYTRANQQIISSYQKSPDSNRAWGHFTQIARDVAIKIGCSVSQYMDGDRFQTYYVCDYGVTNIFDQPIYDAGPTASKCKSGTNPNYPALCSESEKYDSEPLDTMFIHY